MSDLTGRTARCTYYPKGGKHFRCPEPVPSDPGLAFFEYRGPGSEHAVRQCLHCGYRDVAHPDLYPLNPATGKPNQDRGHSFEPRGPAEQDVYYCGCWGWD